MKIKIHNPMYGIPVSALEQPIYEIFSIVCVAENEDLYNMKIRVYTPKECHSAYRVKFNKSGNYDLNASAVLLIDNKLEKVYKRVLIRKNNEG